MSATKDRLFDLMMWTHDIAFAAMLQYELSGMYFDMLRLEEYGAAESIITELAERLGTSEKARAYIEGNVEVMHEDLSEKSLLDEAFLQGLNDARDYVVSFTAHACRRYGQDTPKTPEFQKEDLKKFPERPYEFPRFR